MKKILTKTAHAIFGQPEPFEMKGHYTLMRYGMPIGWAKPLRSKWYRKPYGYSVLGIRKNYAGTAYTMGAAFMMASKCNEESDNRLWI